MTEFEFTLKFAVPNTEVELNDYADQLYAAGCDDALIGIGQTGRLALQFDRQAESGIQAVTSAIVDVINVIPEAILIEASPDLVGLTDIADLVGFSRQNMRALMLRHNSDFPLPVHDGKTAIWHLAKVLNWFQTNQKKQIERSLLEIAKANMQVNISKEAAELDPKVSVGLCG